VKSTPRAILLVHGAWHGAWCWQRVVSLLSNGKFVVRSVDLPSVGAAPDLPVGLESDAMAVQKAIDEVEGPVLLCGHSYGGMVISHAACQNPRVSKLVYLCAFVPESGQSLTAIGGGRLAPWIQVLEGGLTRPDPAQALELFYADCDAKTQAWAMAQIRPQCGAPFADAVPHPGWKSVSSTYVVCSADRAMPPAWQRDLFAPRLNKVLEIDSSHSPFLSQPETVAALLAAESQD
jgi:pimeloyl-ACP methyl ester carboxylesterase